MTQLQNATNIPDMQARIEQTIERLNRLLVSEDSDSEEQGQADSSELTAEETAMLETVTQFDEGLNVINAQP